MLKIRLIKPEVTYGLRQKILRPQQTIEECKYASDASEESFHLGAFSNDKLISVASFYQEDDPQITGEKQYRLRGMATVETSRGQGAGRSLIEAAEKEMRGRGVDVWWCNARTSVSGYYEKMGLNAIGDVFDIHPIGPHKLMYKTLK
ncbi:GNAT family N-acetyltransferase [Alkalihalobacillus sp. TS-13]|uniref:GNAT family N-acetyltransferase n=1 Tax=Alkalihalobacillus sp. TS-13 TaxID=2842455 RepID=UPI001C87B435|nr:GNAT family N-acetyltransferase [Alkalihalobacillus sp. TS-13]